MFNGKIVSGKSLGANDFKDDDRNNGKNPNYIVKTTSQDGTGISGSAPDKNGVEDEKKLQQMHPGDQTTVYKKHLGGLVYTKEEAYNEALSFFLQNGIVLNEEQLYNLREGILGSVVGGVASGIASSVTTNNIQKRQEKKQQHQQQKINNQQQQNLNNNINNQQNNNQNVRESFNNPITNPNSTEKAMQNQAKLVGAAAHYAVKGGKAIAKNVANNINNRQQ